MARLLSAAALVAAVQGRELAQFSSGADNYDYLMLEQQWAITECQDAFSCVAENLYFTLHGLWPEREDGSYPESCGQARRPLLVSAQSGRLLAHLSLQGKPYDSSITASLQPGMDTYWPSLNGGSSDSFWSHEWDKHGRCAIDVLPDQRTYFASTLDMLSRFNITVALAAHGLHPTNAGQLSLAAIDFALIAELGFTAQFKCDSLQRIETVTQCVDKNLNLRACNGPSKCPANVWLPAAQEEPVQPVPPVRPPAAPPPPPYPPGAAPSQCSSFQQVADGGVKPIEDATWIFARAADCPSVCSVCSAGCLFCSSAWDGAGKPPTGLPYDLSASAGWLGVATTAQECSRYAADLETGASVRVSGMTGTYSPKTGTRVSSSGSSCGEWGLA